MRPYIMFTADIWMRNNGIKVAEHGCFLIVKPSRHIRTSHQPFVKRKRTTVSSPRRNLNRFEYSSECLKKRSNGHDDGLISSLEKRGRFQSGQRGRGSTS